MTDKGPRIRKIPEGDSHERLTCPECDHIHYENPHVVNVTVPVYKDPVTGEDMFLLARRDIEPRKGYWTLPGGYMENGETPQGGAHRETEEEAGAEVRVGALLVIYQPPLKNEVVMIFRGEMDSPNFKAGVESQEVKLFKWSDIPWKELAFPLVYEGLKAYQEFKGKTEFQPKMIESKPWQRPPASNTNTPTDKPKPPQPPAGPKF
jgi:ADP-ribose pyrophosphatase YjhB (NUDIX family)